MPEKRPPTLQSIAKQAGVYPSTVSRALRNSPEISQKTCQRIQKIAQKVGYRPDPFAQTLYNRRRSPKKNTFQGLLICLLGHTDQNPLNYLEDYRQAYQGAQTKASEQGYGLDHLWVYQEGLHKSGLDRILRARGALGLVRLGLHYTEVNLNWDNYSCAAISFGRNPFELDRHSFSSVDPYEMTQLGVSQLLDRGYQRIGLALRRRYEHNSQNRFHAAFAGLYERNSIPKKRRCPPFYWDDHEEKPFVRFARWVNKEKPDAIVTLYDFEEIRKWLCTLGLRSPGHMGLIDLAVPTGKNTISGVQVDYSELGAAAAELTIQSVYHNQKGFPSVLRKIFISPRWIDGKSVRKSRKHKSLKEK